MRKYLSTDRYVLDEGGQSASRVNLIASPFSVYVSRDGDTFMRLAIKFLGDQSRYWEIADINPHVEWPDTIPTGTSIRIPI